MSSKADDDVGLGDRGARAQALVERMARREVQAAALVDDGGLQELGKLDKQAHPGRCAREAVRDEHGELGLDQQTRGFLDGARFALRRRGYREFRHRQPGVFRNRPLLQVTVEREHDGRHRRRHRHLVGPHGGFREVRERPRRIVPLREVTHHVRRILHAVVPLRTAP